MAVIYLFIYLFITRFISHVKSFTKWRIASAGWSQVSVGKPGCKVQFLNATWTFQGCVQFHVMRVQFYLLCSFHVLAWWLYHSRTSVITKWCCISFEFNLKMNCGRSNFIQHSYSLSNWYTILTVIYNLGNEIMYVDSRYGDNEYCVNVTRLNK